jgi:beta-lactamase class A
VLHSPTDAGKDDGNNRVPPHPASRIPYTSRATRLWSVVGILCMVLAGCHATPVTEPEHAAARSIPTTTPRVLTPDPELERLIRVTLGDGAGHFGVVVRDLQHGTAAAVNPDRGFYAASLFKLAVMYETFRQDASGRLPLHSLLTLTATDAAEDLGTLDLLDLHVGDRLSVEDLVDLMITASDNTASSMLRNALGRQAIDQDIKALGLSGTSVVNPELPTTAADMAALLEAIATGRAVSKAASKEMAELLLRQRVRDRIPAGIPEGVLVGNKTGNWSNATHDVAIVYSPAGTYVLAVLSDIPDDGLITELSRQVYEYYNRDAGR